MNNEPLTMNILDLLFPKKCVGCSKVGGLGEAASSAYFCVACIRDIQQTDLVCPFCERASIGGVTHPVCKRRYGLDGLWSLGVYQTSLREALQQLKYRWIKNLAEVLIDTTIEYWARYQPHLLDEIKKNQGKNWLVVPVPLHWTRRNFRGFNQAFLLGQILSKKLGLDFASCLKRARLTKSQVGLDSQQRRDNVRGAFALTMNHELSTKNIILIDDVWTTGSTLKECCYVLKRAGAKKVWALTLAR